ncbi:hypothetical protein [Caudoviricetes sp.]|nr:hypothetical protein [Caudoviricetes sp.]UOF81904.1 hypothetical protein [Caudoviricetes sp.]
MLSLEIPNVRSSGAVPGLAAVRCGVPRYRLT